MLERWRERFVELFPEGSRAFFRDKRDPFANPIGHAIRTASEAILDDLLADADTERTARALDDLIRILAIQKLAPSQAAAFPFALKDSIRAVAADDGDGEGLAVHGPALLELETRVDGLALRAFNIYMSCRERLFTIRTREIRGMARLRAGEAQADAPGAAADPKQEALTGIGGNGS